METSVSKREIAEVSAAKKTKMKKTAPITVPRAMLLKTFGSILNIRDGPDASISAFPPENTKTAGTIISPDRNATPVSNISTCETDFSRLDFFGI